MRGLILFLLCGFAFATQEQNHTKWMHAVEEILATVTLGPLKEEFTPSYLAKRTQSGALRMQTNRFRAQVAASMVECTSDRVTVCPYPSTSDPAIEEVQKELETRGFEVYWLKTKCLLVHVPEAEINSE